MAADIAELIEFLKPQCSRLKYGKCMTLACLKRGGYDYGLLGSQSIDYDVATCEEFEISAILSNLAKTPA